MWHAGMLHGDLSKYPQNQCPAYPVALFFGQVGQEPDNPEQDVPCKHLQRGFMKNIVYLFMILFLSSCSSKPSVVQKNESEMLSTDTIPVQMSVGKEVEQQQQPDSKPSHGDILTAVSVSSSSFNPGLKGVVDLRFILKQKAKVTVNVYDPDWGLVTSLMTGEFLDPGKQSVTWNGRIQNNVVVPDEVYFFTIFAENESGEREIYDPVIFSGGVSHDIVKVDINKENQTLNYRMPEMGRVLIRVGIQGGPLMNTVVDWEPRGKGVVTEYWNGMDSNGLMDLYSTPSSKMIVTYFTFPENSVITYGNSDIDYRTYKKQQDKDTVTKPDRGTLTKDVSHHFKLPRIIDHAPRLNVSFTNAVNEQSDKVSLKSKSIVRVDLDEADKEIFTNQQFEIAFFLDGQFYAEDEVGYTPFNWVWDLAQVEPGEHILTVNVSGFRDQVGVFSRRVEVIK